MTLDSLGSRPIISGSLHVDRGGRGRGSERDAMAGMGSVSGDMRRTRPTIAGSEDSERALS